MKKRFFLIFILLNLFFVLAGCGNSPYSIEREYWYLQNRAKKIFVNPDASPNRQVNKIISALNNFAKRHPDTSLEISAEFSIANLYIAKKEYSLARQQLQNIIVKHNNLDSVCSEALFLTGNSYELEDKWPQALLKYNEVTSRYPVTKRGMDVPLYIAQYYKTKYQPDKMREAYNQAANHYVRLSQANLDTKLGFTAVLLATEAKFAIKDFQGCINIFDSVVKNYKNEDMQASAMMNMALIYLNGFKDKTKTKETLQSLINNYPKNRIVNNAKKFLKELEKK